MKTPADPMPPPSTPPCLDDVGMEPCTAAQCPCAGCDRRIMFDGFNKHMTCAFVVCDKCSHTAVIYVPMIKTWSGPP